MSSTSLLELPTGKARSEKLLCGVVLTLVFLCGGVVGALALDFGIHGRARTPAFETPQGKAVYFEHMRKELDLTPAQAEQIEQILNDFWVYYRNVLSGSKQQVEQLLNEDQRKKFEHFLQQPPR